MSKKKNQEPALEAKATKKKESKILDQEISSKKSLISEEEMNSFYEEPEPDEFPEEFLEENVEEEEEEFDFEKEFLPEPTTMSFEDETRAKERALRKR